MNKELLLRVADAIEAEEELVFNMNYFSSTGFYVKERSTMFKRRGTPECKTAACIAGFAVFLHDKELFRQSIYMDLIAEEFLELERDQATKLFCHSHVDRAKAAAVIHNLVETGEVDWNVRAVSVPGRSPWRLMANIQYDEEKERVAALEELV